MSIRSITIDLYFQKSILGNGFPGILGSNGMPGMPGVPGPQGPREEKVQKGKLEIRDRKECWVQEETEGAKGLPERADPEESRELKVNQDLWEWKESQALWEIKEEKETKERKEKAPKQVKQV